MSGSLRHILSIDLGTSGPKAALVAETGAILATAHASVPTILLPEDGAEQDPREVWRAVCSACTSVLQAAHVPPAAIVGIICSSQYASVVPVDRSGEPVSNMVVWLDRRGAPKAMERYRARGYRPDSYYRKWRWLRIHGLLPLDSGQDGLAHIRWLQYARPEICEKTAYFLEPVDYLTMRFSGRATANHCTAFLTLLTDNRTQNQTAWHPALMRYAGIDAAKLPELISDRSIVGPVLPEVARELGLALGTPVITGVNDTQAAALACHAFQGAHAAIGVGTSSVMVTHVSFKKTDPFHSMYSMPSPVPGVRFAVAENGVAGKALEHFLERLVFAQDRFGNHAAEERFQLLDAAVGSVAPGSNGVIFLPWVDGAMAPVSDAHMRGGFLNISLQTSREDLARAVLEGVALSFRWLRDSTEHFARRPVSHYLYYGGGAMSDVWSQINADVLGAPVHQMKNPRYINCLGTALLAFERLGAIRFSDFPRLAPVRRICEPRAEHHARYEALFVQFKRIFKKNRGIFRDLNAIKRG
ncbi:MAG: FGGY-family carbohydrate kinase [Candidatus Hydrogenedentes bacterium]|nr:FGGY-family carbohydrate kinase [Candidatus Hydrogenedentota bacterium]